MLSQEVLLLILSASTAYASPLRYKREGGGASPGQVPVRWTEHNFIGTFIIAGQEMNVVMDTGSNLFWVRRTLSADELTDAVSPGTSWPQANGLYDPQAYGAAPLEAHSWNQQYVGDKNSGNAGPSGVEQITAAIGAPREFNDSPTVGQSGSSTAGLSTSNVDVAICNKNIKNGGMDEKATAGLVGLGLTDKNFMTDSGLPQIFSVNMPAPGNLGYFNFGDTSDANDRALAWQKTTKKYKGYWTTNSDTGDHLKVGNSQISMHGTQMRVLLDTGTTMTNLPKQTCEELYAYLGGSCEQEDDGKYQCTYVCNDYTDTSTFPAISLPWDQGNGVYIDLDMREFFHSKKSDDPTRCHGRIQPKKDATAKTSMYGTIVFRSAKFVFDATEGGNERVGMKPYEGIVRGDVNAASKVGYSGSNGNGNTVSPGAGTESGNGGDSSGHDSGVTQGGDASGDGSGSGESDSGNGNSGFGDDEGASGNNDGNGKGNDQGTSEVGAVSETTDDGNGNGSPGAGNDDINPKDRPESSSQGEIHAPSGDDDNEESNGQDGNGWDRDGQDFGTEMNGDAFENGNNFGPW